MNEPFRHELWCLRRIKKVFCSLHDPAHHGYDVIFVEFRNAFDGRAFKLTCPHMWKHAKRVTAIELRIRLCARCWDIGRLRNHSLLSISILFAVKDSFCSASPWSQFWQWSMVTRAGLKQYRLLTSQPPQSRLLFTPSKFWDMSSWNNCTPIVVFSSSLQSSRCCAQCSVITKRRPLRTDLRRTKNARGSIKR